VSVGGVCLGTEVVTLRKGLFRMVGKEYGWSE
jgi:hypothetical protein